MFDATLFGLGPKIYVGLAETIFSATSYLVIFYVLGVKLDKIAKLNDILKDPELAKWVIALTSNLAAAFCTMFLVIGVALQYFRAGPTSTASVDLIPSVTRTADLGVLPDKATL